MSLDVHVELKIVNKDLFLRELLNYTAPLEQRSFVKYNYNGACWDLPWIGVSVGSTG